MAYISDCLKFQMKVEELGVKPIYSTSLRCAMCKFMNNTLLFTDSLERREDYDVFFGIVVENEEMDDFIKGYEKFSKKRKNKGVSAAKYGYYLSHKANDKTGWILPEMLDMLPDLSE